MSEHGLRYNEGKPRWSLVHYASLVPLVRALEYGATKYDIDNWKKGMEPRKVLESLQRHVAALSDGETHDAESNVSHIGHILANAMIYSYYTETEEGKPKAL